jgi:hypothetical protein
LLCQILFLFFFLLTQWLFCLQDYEKACDAFLDGFKLDPTNAEIEKALWYYTHNTFIIRQHIYPYSIQKFHCIVTCIWWLIQRIR